MNQILVCKGQYEIIRDEKNAPKARKLYDYICNFFSQQRYGFKLIETNSEKNIPEYIREETKYLVGHSNGTIRILKEVVPGNCPWVQGLILFDTRLEYLKNYSIRSLVFLSERWQSQSVQTKSGTIVNLDDDHYFNNSLEMIGQSMLPFLGL